MRSLRVKRGIACLGVLFVLGGTAAPSALAAKGEKKQQDGTVTTQGGRARKWR